MRNSIHYSHLTPTTTEGRRRYRTRIPRVRRRRKRKSTAPQLVTLGSLAGISARNFLKRRRLAEGCPTSRIGPEAAEQNGRKLNAISSRSLEQAWLKQHQAEYAGAWVALEGARLVAQGSSARQVLDAARSEGYTQPLIVHIPSGPELPFGGW